ncbi:MAG: OsmC family protein [Acidianus infernus]|nr:OsmC family protein [Acidianus infernus]
MIKTNVMNIKVTSKSVSETKSEIKVRHFTLVVDEPEYFGGTDSGPNPLEYLLTALAGCISITLQLVAREKGIKVRNVSLEITGTLDTDKFLGKDMNKRAALNKIKVNLSVDADAPKEVIEKLVEETETRRPVTDTLKNGTTVEINLR